MSLVFHLVETAEQVSARLYLDGKLVLDFLEPAPCLIHTRRDTRSEQELKENATYFGADYEDGAVGALNDMKRSEDSAISLHVKEIRRTLRKISVRSENRSRIFRVLNRLSIED